MSRDFHSKNIVNCTTTPKTQDKESKKHFVQVTAHHHLFKQSKLGKMDASFTGESDAGLSAASRMVSDSMDSNIVKIRESLDNVEAYSSSLLETLKHNIQHFCAASIDWLKSLEQNDKVDALKSGLKDIIDKLKSHQVFIRILDRVDSFKYVMFKEVSKQAIYFGCGGLLTGAIIGIAYGYSIRGSSGYNVHNGSANNYLMRAIVAANTRRGIDGVTLMVLKTPQVLNPDDVVIQIRAVGLDIIDTEIAKGYLHSLRSHYGLCKISEPFILGRECAGVVVDVGSQVETLEINDRVWAYVPLWSEKGFMSEYVAVPEKFVALKPNNISFEGAATMPYAFITFWQECIEKYEINPNDIKNKRILIHLGVSSKNDGVGLLATQILKSWGARVTISTEESIIMEGDSSSEVAQMTFLHSLKTLGAESHLIIPADHNQLSNLAQRLFDIVINTDSSTITPLLSYFCKNPNDKVIETFPIEVHHTSGVGRLLLSTLLTPFHRIFEQAEMEIDPPNLKLNECKRLVESRLIVPIVAKSFLPSQYDQGFRHVARSSESALAHATVGKSVLVFKSAFK